MKRYTTWQLRERLAEALDAAERGEGVIVERRGVTFTVQFRPAKRSSRSPKPVVEIVDPAVDAGNWSWQSTTRGLAFKAPRRK